MSEKTYQLQTLSRALDVLTLIEISPEPMTLTAIADRMGWGLGETLERAVELLEREYQR